MEANKTDRLELYGYRLDRILGRGGTGTVYRGIHPETGEVRALKLFFANFFRDRWHERDLAKSAQNFIKFSHPNVVRIYDFLTGKDGSCLVQEYVDGPDLKFYLDKRPWDLRERLVVVAQICNGLQYIHDQGFTHHDLKPANILFTRKGQLKLTDYSLCRGRMLPFLDSGLTEQITPMYVAPELIEKKDATPRSDIYSLGVTLYLMFACKVPFEVDSLQKLYFCHLNVNPLHPTDVNRRCPRDLGDVIMRMMEKDPMKRYENCYELGIVLSGVGKSRI